MAEIPSSWLSPKTIAQIGVTSLVTLYVVFVVGQLIPKTYAAVIQIAQDMGMLKEEHASIREALEVKMNEGNRLLCAQCYIMAKGDETTNKLCACNASPPELRPFSER